MDMYKWTCKNNKVLGVRKSMVLHMWQSRANAGTGMSKVKKYCTISFVG